MLLPRCNLLHWSLAAGKMPDVPEHVHSFYQIELCVAGYIKFSAAGKKFKLMPGEWMLIPPGAAHGMSYGGKELEYYSFKFEVQNLPQKVAPQLFYQPASVLGNYVIGTLKQLHPADKYLFLPINENRVILESLLFNLLQQALAPLQQSDPVPGLLSDLADLVTEYGALTNVQSAAEWLNMNVSQLKYRYGQVRRKHIDKLQHVTLKEFIDRQIMQQIDRFLLYSNLSLSQIAQQTQFNNIYTFSRFVKRMTGESPLHRRQKQQTGQS